MTNTQPYRVKTITEYHRLLGLPKPQHPLISVVHLESFTPPVMDGPVSVVFDFYSIAIKRDLTVKIKYGQQSCDFDEGMLFCMSPGQVINLSANKGTTNTPKGWMILVHPDFLWNTPLAKSIKQYEYFNYSVNEALYLSDKEQAMITGIVQYIEQEYHSNIDKFSESVIIAHLEVILTYAERFYQRQFLTRKVANHQILNRMENTLNAYFESDALITKGLPTVAYLAEVLNVSPNYLGSLLKVLTGQNAQQHIHEKLIEKAKERLSTTGLSVSEIAYELGFEHPQSFSKLFKTKTNLTPLEFRASFN
jgi:AraC-like DNA-binding protein